MKQGNIPLLVLPPIYSREIICASLTSTEEDTALQCLRQFIYRCLNEGTPILRTTPIGIYREGKLFRIIEFPTDYIHIAKGGIRIRPPKLIRVLLFGLMTLGIIGWLSLIAGVVMVIMHGNWWVLGGGWATLVLFVLLQEKFGGIIEQNQMLQESYFCSHII